MNVDKAAILRRFPELARLPAADLLAVAERADVTTLSSGERLFERDQPMPGLFAILGGRIRLHVGDPSSPLAELGEPDGFGALDARPSPHSAVVDQATTTLLRIGRADLEPLADTRPAIAALLRPAIALPPSLQRVRLLAGLDPTRRNEIATRLEPRELRPGEILIREGEIGHELLLVESGRLAVMRGETRAGTVGPGDVVGEIALARGEPRSATVVAETACRVHALGETDFRALLAEQESFARGVRELLERRADVPAPPRSAPPPAHDRAPFDSASPPRQRREALVRQPGSRDCGAACLATVARLYGQRPSLNWVREQARVGRNGAALADLETTAHAMGFETAALQATWGTLAASDAPAIVGWRGVHWLVVIEVRGDVARIADPARGLVEMTRTEFERGFTRHALFLRPGDDFVARSAAATKAKAPVISLGPQRREAVELGLGFLAAALLALSIPLFVRFAVDEIALAGHTRQLPAVLLTTILALAIGWVLEASGRQRVAYLEFDLSARLNRTWAERLFALPLAFHDRRWPDDLAARQLDAERLAAVAVSGIAGAVRAGLGALARLALVAVLAPPLAPFAAAILLLRGWLARRAEQRRQSARVDDGLADLLEALPTIRAFGAEARALRRWEAERDASDFAEPMAAASGDSGLALCDRLLPATLLIGSSWLALVGQISPGAVAAIWFATLPLVRDSAEALTFVRRRAEIDELGERLDDVLGRAVEARPGDGPRLELQGNFRVAGVGFQYGEGSEAVAGLDLEIAEGERVGVVGPSGAGKTTLLQLLAGLRPASRGDITLDGFDVATIPMASLGPSLAWLPATPELFPGTVRENLTLASGDVDAAALESALRLSGAIEVVRRLELGLDTPLAAQLERLSEGDRQRLALARALVTRPRILLLDEALTALDPEAERLVVESLKLGEPRRTLVVVSHRPSVLRSLDRILVLDRGRLVETGRHDELLQARGLYSFLIRGWSAP